MASSPKENHDEGETSNPQPPRTVVLALPAINYDSGRRPPIVKVYRRRSKVSQSSDAAAVVDPSPSLAPAPAVEEEKEVAAREIPEPGEGWVRLSFRGIKPKRFIGLKCKIFWPEDFEWYPGRVARYDHKTKKHRIAYDDGDVETLALKDERIHFYLP